MDADKDTREMYAEFFNYFGYHVIAVTNARDAIACAPGVDVIVTETMLPGDVGGLAMIARLKEDRLTDCIPLLVVSSWAWEEDQLRATRAGCDVFLPKPCLPDDLLQATRRALGQRLDRRAADEGQQPAVAQRTPLTARRLASTQAQDLRWSPAAYHPRLA